MPYIKLERFKLLKFYVLCVLDLVYCGHILHDDVSLASCGISNGSTVLAVKKTHHLESAPTTGIYSHFKALNY